MAKRTLAPFFQIAKENGISNNINDFISLVKSNGVNYAKKTLQNYLISTIEINKNEEVKEASIGAVMSVHNAMQKIISESELPEEEKQTVTNKVFRECLCLLGLNLTPNLPTRVGTAPTTRQEDERKMSYHKGYVPSVNMMDSKQLAWFASKRITTLGGQNELPIYTTLIGDALFKFLIFAVEPFIKSWELNEDEGIGLAVFGFLFCSFVFNNGVFFAQGGPTDFESICESFFKLSEMREAAYIGPREHDALWLMVEELITGQKLVEELAIQKRMGLALVGYRLAFCSLRFVFTKETEFLHEM